MGEQQTNASNAHLLLKGGLSRLHALELGQDSSEQLLGGGRLRLSSPVGFGGALGAHVGVVEGD
jgi:hypothetical protein